MSGLLAPLQTGVCDASTSGATYLTDFEFIKAFTCTYANAVGLLVVGVFVYGAISTSIYIRTNSVLIPFVLLLLTGGAVMTQLASIATALATLLLLATGAGVITLLWYQYSR
jgi:hypothetical protein